MRPGYTVLRRVGPAVALSVAGILVFLAFIAAALALRTGIPAGPTRLIEVSFDDLPGWAEDNHRAAVATFLRSCPRVSAGAKLLAACEAATALPADDPDAARDFFEAWFVPHAVRQGFRRTGLITGYYEPQLAGSRIREGPYQTPLYRRPDDLVMVDLGQFRSSLRGERIAGAVKDGYLRPYPDRAAIEAGALARRAGVLAYVEDPVAAFFLQVQGSGRIRLPDGSILRVGYDGHNGHPYTSIGRELIRRGALEREMVSLQSIRAWLADNPAQRAALLNENASYIFFREVPVSDPALGPLGALGIPLTPGRSIAVDRTRHQLGLPVYLVTEYPAADGATMRPFRRIMVAQDTGGAIRGPIRGDVFWGWGADAEAIAGQMKSEGRFYVLLPSTPPG